MIVLTLARKPVPGSVSRNVAERGTGALNIDGCRISCEETLKGGRGLLWSHYRDGTEKRAEPKTNEGFGRWPANVMFQHLQGCVQGEPRHDAVPLFESSHSSRYIGCEGVTIQSTGESRTMMTESWTCQPGCPVADLDTQSGVSVSVRSAGRNGKDDARATFGLQRSDDLPRGHNDAGTAARFFKQFHG